MCTLANAGSFVLGMLRKLEALKTVSWKAPGYATSFHSTVKCYCLLLLLVTVCACGQLCVCSKLPDTRQCCWLVIELEELQPYLDKPALVPVRNNHWSIFT